MSEPCRLCKDLELAAARVIEAIDKVYLDGDLGKIHGAYNAIGDLERILDDIRNERKASEERESA